MNIGPGTLKCVSMVCNDGNITIEPNWEYLGRDRIKALCDGVYSYEDPKELYEALLEIKDIIDNKWR